MEDLIIMQRIKVIRDMTKENKDLLIKLLQQHKALGISDQIDFDKFYLDSIISNSVSLVGDDYGVRGR